NPYTALAAILAGIASPAGADSAVPASYDRALDRFADSGQMGDLLWRELHGNLVRQRRAEQAGLAAAIRPLEYLWYLHTV
ncbi:MAG: hypothetical protein HOK81_12310, partial [Rhodospirillaceae bacterium]|nr:hypothetical protein [Rhodospirillaceae bacterium]